MKPLLLFLLASLLPLCAQARQIIDLTSGQLSPDSALAAPEKIVDYVEDGIIVTYKINRAALGRDGVRDQKATIGMRCNSGVKLAYLFVGGMPQGNGMKMYISKY